MFLLERLEFSADVGEHCKKHCGGVPDPTRPNPNDPDRRARSGLCCSARHKHSVCRTENMTRVHAAVPPRTGWFKAISNHVPQL